MKNTIQVSTVLRSCCAVAAASFPFFPYPYPYLPYHNLNQFTRYNTAPCLSIFYNNNYIEPRRAPRRNKLYTIGKFPAYIHAVIYGKLGKKNGFI
jgi:hypothetical protein